MENKNNKDVEMIRKTNRTTGIIVLGIALVMFMLGYLSKFNKEEAISFTYEEIQMIEKFQLQLENDIGSSAEAVVYKTKDGEMRLSWK